MSEIKKFFNHYNDFILSVTADVSKNDELFVERFKYLSEKLNGRFSRMDNSIAGLAGEAGEVADMWKKIKYHNLDYNDETKEKLIKELGDICWYLFSVADVLDVSVEEIINKNIEKLKARHVNGFSAEYLKKTILKKED
jgi:NTP pyrophosphatase (non-canonical NTP hydrolase)